MGTPYTDIIDNFSKMITEYKFTSLLEEDRDDWILSLLKSALSKFYKKNPIKLSKYDDNGFTNELTEDEIDILCNLMIVEWLKPYLFSVDNLENVMTTKDWSMYSTANLLKEIRSTYDAARLDAKRMATNYTYTLRNKRRGDMYD